MLRVLTGGVVAGIVLFAWAFVSYMFIPWHVMGRMPEEQHVRQVLRDTVAEAGMYWIPGIDMSEMGADVPEAQREAATERWTAAYREGPVALVAYSPEGRDPMAVGQMAIGLVLEIALATVAAVLLRMAGPALPFYRQRLLFVLVIGLFTVVGTNLMNWNWMNFPARFSLEMAGETMVQTLLMALVLAAIVRPGGGRGATGEIGAL